MKKLITILITLLVTLLLVSVSCGTHKIDPAGVPPDDAVKGELVLVDGALRVNQVPAGDSFLLVWPNGYSRRSEDGEIIILDPDGQTMTRVGDIVIVRGVVTSAAGAAKHVGPLMPEVAKGPYWSVKEVISSLPESGPLTQERINELAEIYQSRTEFFNWAVYAEEHGITMKEAIGRFSLVDDAGLLGSVLEELEKETFAGLWVEHTTDDAGPPGTMQEELEKETLARLWVDYPPAFRVIVAFSENGEETIKKYVKEDSPLAKAIELRTFEATLEELKLAQQEASQLLQNLGLPTSSHIDVVKNYVVLWITDNDLLQSTLQKAGEKLPEHVVTSIVYEPADEPPPGINPDPSVHLPQLKTRSGSFMEARMVGELTLEDDYLRVNGTLIIWQPDYFVHNNDGTIEVLDRDGAVVGRVGEEIVMGGGGTDSIEFINQLLKEPLPPDTEGPFWLQGGGTRLSLNFSSDLFSLEVITSGEDKVYFLKKKTLLDETARQEIVLTGSLVASYSGVLTKYPHIRVEAKPEENKGSVRYTTFWPANYQARIENGVFEILGRSGRVVLRDGEEADIAGKVIYGYSEQLHNELPGGYSGPYLIVNGVSRGEE